MPFDWGVVAAVGAAAGGGGAAGAGAATFLRTIVSLLAIPRDDSGIIDVSEGNCIANRQL